MLRFMASQLRQPSGWFGSIVMSRLLNKVNTQIVDTTLALMDVKPEHRVLEIGFGGGSALSHLVDSAGSGAIAGVDISPEMVRRAESKFSSEIRSGRLQVQVGDISKLPFADALFDRVFTINTIYFWPNTLGGLRELYRVLRKDGRATISIRSKNKMEKQSVTNYGFRLFSADELAVLMAQSGFREIRVDHRDQDKWYDQVIVVGCR